MTTSTVEVDSLDRFAPSDGEPAVSEPRAVAELFRVLGDTTRVRVLGALRAQPMCVKDLVAMLGLQQSTVSHQLKVLRHNRLVRYRRDGRRIIYALDDRHVFDLIDTALAHTRES